ncbi:uncharacterized protein LOC125521136 isoform X6 [Triticum urartu]|uniref:uncharacterized protein LOC125521136 isoform X6 n=1 Tax=Triticum urartu TaxID=4572 RepID=UPI0020448A0A|nr:uncharacterized protein LOC125521136 isoform X6 [Triticum urartu]
MAGTCKKRNWEEHPAASPDPDHDSFADNDSSSSIGEQHTEGEYDKLRASSGPCSSNLCVFRHGWETCRQIAYKPGKQANQFAAESMEIAYKTSGDGGVLKEGEEVSHECAGYLSGRKKMTKNVCG